MFRKILDGILRTKQRRLLTGATLVIIGIASAYLSWMATRGWYFNLGGNMYTAAEFSKVCHKLVSNGYSNALPLYESAVHEHTKQKCFQVLYAIIFFVSITVGIFILHQKLTRFLNFARK